MSAPYFADGSVTLWQGHDLDVLRRLPDGSADCVITSPPYYGLRDYGVDGQRGLEATPAEFIAGMVEVFTEVRRVLTDDGTCWVNLGDSYSAAGGHGDPNGTSTLQGRRQLMQTVPGKGSDRPRKSLLGMPWRVALALQDDGWILRNAIVWDKPNAMPESVTDRLANRYETLFLLTKSQRYWFDLDAIREPHIYPEAADGTRVFGGSNKGSNGGVGATARRRGNNTYGGRHDPLEGDHGTAGQDGNGRRYLAKTSHTSGRNPGDVWSIPTQPFPGSHFATYPEELVRRAVLAGCPPRRCITCGHAPARVTRTRQVGTGRTTNGPRSSARTHETPGYTNRTIAARETTGWTDCGHDTHRPGLVLDPYSGSGTTGLIATRHGRRYTGIDLNPDYLDLSLRTRLSQGTLLPEDGAA